MSPRRHSHFARLAGFVIASGACLASVQTAHANESQQATESQPATPTVIILDASGSMLDDDAPGLRIDAAKSAIHSLVGELPDAAQVGLVVYGTGTGSEDSEKTAGCQDVTTLVPVGPIDDRSFLKTVDEISASGYTPIGKALRQAADELPNEGPRSIVLVSDGLDTCSPPPPCEVAKEIASDGLDLTVHTVGFKVDDDARADLQCIADVTGGTYSNADSASELSGALITRVEHAIGTYEAEGESVTGTPTIVAETPPLAPGQYVDTFEAGSDNLTGPGTEKFYRVHVPEGWTAHAAATMVMPPGTKEDGGSALNSYIKFVNKEGRQCGTTGYQHMNRTFAITAPSTAIADSNRCEDEDLYLSIHRAGPRFKQTPATTEILLRLEPPADATGLPGPEIGSAAEAPLHSSAAMPIEGGLSFNRAVELVPGQTYESAVVAGEYRYYKVPVTWGQHLAYRIDIADRDDENSKEWTRIRATWYNPLRADINELSAFTLDLGRQDGTTDTMSEGSTEPVRYGSKTYGFAGYYYFTLGPEELNEDAPFQVPFTITVATPGEPEEGPVYDLSAAQALDRSENQDSDPQPEASTRPDAGERADADETGISSTVIWAVGGVLLLIVGGLVGLVIMRRR